MIVPAIVPTIEPGAAKQAGSSIDNSATAVSSYPVPSLALPKLNRPA